MSKGDKRHANIVHLHLLLERAIGMIVGDKAMEGSMPEKAYASLVEEFEDFWKGVKEGGKPGGHENFKVDAILGGNVDQDWNLGVRCQGRKEIVPSGRSKTVPPNVAEYASLPRGL